VFFVTTLIFGVVDESVVETGLKPVSTHVINYGSSKSVNKTHHEPNTLFWNSQSGGQSHYQLNSCFNIYVL